MPLEGFAIYGGSNGREKSNHRDLIFNQFANFLNSFDPSVSIELSYINQLGRNEEMQSAIQIPDKNL